MHEQPSFKVAWTPYDPRMIIRLTSESLQTQAPSSHIHATYLRVYPDSITELRVNPDPQLMRVIPDP